MNTTLIQDMEEATAWVRSVAECIGEINPERPSKIRKHLLTLERVLALMKTDSTALERSNLAPALVQALAGLGRQP